MRSAGGGHLAHAQQIVPCVTGRAAELQAWCRRQDVTVDVSERLWTIYVDSKARAKMGLLKGTLSGGEILDRAQKVQGRRILRWGSHPASASVYIELGWTPWSVAARGEAVRLFGRAGR